MDRDRLEHALKIVASEPGSALETAFSSMVNLIIENHERTVNSVICLVQLNSRVKPKNCLQLHVLTWINYLVLLSLFQF